MLSKRYESTEVHRRTWLHVSSNYVIIMAITRGATANKKTGSNQVSGKRTLLDDSW